MMKKKLLSIIKPDFPETTEPSEKRKRMMLGRVILVVLISIIIMIFLGAIEILYDSFQLLANKPVEPDSIFFDINTQFFYFSLIIGSVFFFWLSPMSSPMILNRAKGEEKSSVGGFFLPYFLSNTTF